MTKKYVSKCLGMSEDDPKMARMLGGYMRKGNITIEEYCAYLSGYNITSNFAKKLMEERKITLAQYLRHFLKDFDHLEYINGWKRGGKPVDMYEVKKHPVSATNDKARMSVMEFKNFLKSGNYEIGNIREDLVKKLLWYNDVFNDPDIFFLNPDKFSCLVRNWGGITVSKQLTEEVFTKYLTNRTPNEKWKVIMYKNQISEEFLLKNEELFYPKKDFVEAVLKYERHYYMTIDLKMFSKEFIQKSNLFKLNGSEVNLPKYTFLRKYPTEMLEELGYKIIDEYPDGKAWGSY